MRRLARKWWPVALLIALAAVTVFLLIVVRDQQESIRNQQASLQRDQVAIEHSRLRSCQQTYRSFPEVFRPFFPADRETWTPKVRQNWDKLIRRSEQLAARCPQQIQP